MNFFKTYQTECWFLAIPLFILIILRLLGFDGLVGQDSYEYLRYTEKIKDFYLTGIHPGDFFWPKGYSLVAGVLAVVIPTNIATQLISLISLLGTFLFTNAIIKLLYKKQKYTLPYLLISLLLSPYLLRSGIVSMSDTLSIFCLTGSFYYGLVYRGEFTFKAIFFCILLGVYSVFTRYAAIIPVAIIFIVVSYYWIKNIRLTHLLVLIIPLILIPIHFFFESRPTDFVQHEWITTWDIFNFYKREFTTVDGIMHYTFPNAVYAFFAFFHPGFFFLGGGLIFLTLKKVKTIITADWIILLSGVVFYSVFLMGIPFQNNRFLLLTYPLVIALIYPGFDWLINRFLPFKRWFFGVFIIFQLGFFARAIQVSFQLCLLEKNIVSQLTHFQNQTLYSFDIDVAIEGRGLEFNYKNLWVEEYKYFEKGALVLFNEEKLKFQWEGKNPMVNWNNLKENYQLTNIKQLDGGWKLYRIGE